VSDDGWPATVTDTTYIGTDTHLHLVLADGTALDARVQSPPGGAISLTRGAEVRITFAPGAAQVLDH
jgi:spermidine/putrescine transport system ATP-binding protein